MFVKKVRDFRLTLTGPQLFILFAFAAIIILELWISSSTFCGQVANRSGFVVNESPSIVQITHDEGVLTDPTVAQDDPRLVRAARQLLLPPSTLPYSFDNMDLANETLNLNPSAGQVQAVQDILEGFGPDSFFVECGANDGEWGSNTIWLERSLGWQGILIEADPRPWQKLLRKQRKAILGNFCLSNIPHPNMLPFYLYNEENALGSGLTYSKGYRPKALYIQCLPLYTVLLALGKTTVEFFSLDIEGNEIEVLLTLPFDKVIFKVITIEHALLKVGKLGLRKFMEERNYIFYRTVVTPDFLSGDSIFIHKSVQLTQEQVAKIGIEDSDLTREVEH